MTELEELKEKKDMGTMVTVEGKNLSTPKIRASDLRGQVHQESALC